MGSTDVFPLIITGGLGCVGIAITKAISERIPNALIHILDIALPVGYESTASPEERRGKKPKDERFSEAVSQYHEVNVADYDNVLKLFHAIKPRAVVHTAALLSTVLKQLHLSTNDMVRVNVEGTRNVVKAATEVGCDALVLTSSCDVAKRDCWKSLINVSEADDDLDDKIGWSDTYSWTKAQAEKIVIAAAKIGGHLRTCAIRTQCVIGPHEKNLIPIFAHMPKGVEVGSGQQLFDFTSVENVALAHVLALKNLMGDGSANGKAFFVTNCEPVSMRAFKEMVWRQLDENPAGPPPEYPFWSIPIWLIYIITGCLDSILRLFGKETPLSTKDIGSGVTVRYYNNTLAKNILGYHPEVSLQQSIKEACLAYKNRE